MSNQQKMKDAIRGGFTTISLIILFCLWAFKLKGYNLFFLKFDLVLFYTILFLLRSSIASFKSWKYDSKKSYTRSSGGVVIVAWILLLIALYYFILPLIA